MEQKLTNLSDQIAALTLLEASELVKVLETVLGVSAAAPQVMMAASSATPEASAEEEKTEFDVILVKGGDNKINVIKEVRAITGLPLKEAKEAAEGANVVIKASVSKADAAKFKAQLEAVGATVNIT